MGLMLHAGAEPITFDQLRQLPAPPVTESHAPVAYHRLIEMVKHSLTYHGHSIEQEDYGVTQQAQRFFGLLSLKSDYGDYTDAIGLRSSYDKSMSIGIAMGSRVFVCDNMALHGERVVKRKNTPRAMRDIMYLLNEIVEPLQAQRRQQFDTFERYKLTALSDMMADHIIMELYRRDVIGVQAISHVLKAYEEPPHDWGDKNCWRIFNSTTFALSGKVAENPRLTQQLHQTIDGVCSTVH